MNWPGVTVANWTRFRQWMDAMLLRSRPDQVVYGFRGQSDVAWGLRPSLARLLERRPVAQAMEIEKAALAEFRAKALLHLPTNIAARTTDVMGWWTIMQHYRAPTRLLDWTFSPYVATYFAVAQGWGTDGVVWYFAGKILDEEMEALGWKLKSEGWWDSNEQIAKYTDETFFREDPPSRLSFVNRRDREERMVAQQGAFTVSPNPLDDHAQVIGQALAGRGRPEFGRLIIPKQQKPAFLQHLRFMNISANSLFPGIEGLGLSVDELVRLFPPPPPPPPSSSPFATSEFSTEVRLPPPLPPLMSPFATSYIVVM